MGSMPHRSQDLLKPHFRDFHISGQQLNIITISQYLLGMLVSTKAVKQSTLDVLVIKPYIIYYIHTKTVRPILLFAIKLQSTFGRFVVVFPTTLFGANTANLFIHKLLFKVSPYTLVLLLFLLQHLAFATCTKSLVYINFNLY